MASVSRKRLPDPAETARQSFAELRFVDTGLPPESGTRAGTVGLLRALLADDGV
jgi:hypothetical protein